jgi:protein-L-isoaspartate O-methyltransferase
VQRALRVCPRDLFVPAGHREEALVDAPIRVEEHDFNISAPHMHVSREHGRATPHRRAYESFSARFNAHRACCFFCRLVCLAEPPACTTNAATAPLYMLAPLQATCLEALQLQPGHRFLDVGSGCGVLTACGAFLVGRQGSAVGFEVRRECIQMGRDALRRLTATNPE